jgi:ethanolamine permease
VVAPAFSWTQFAHHGWPQGWAGVLAGIPFAIWFYLAIEGVANAAEEARNPRRDISFGFGAAIATLVALATLVFFLGIGVGGWEAIVYDGSSIVRDPSGLVRSVAGGAATLDKPLPLALGQVVRPGHLLYRLLTGIGLLGLVASFHGIILAAGRALLSMGRAGFLPRFLGRVNGATRTPAHALLLNAALGIAAILFLDTGALLTLSALGAALLYVVAMLSLFALRRKEPELPRPFRAPLYPWFPLLALGIALVAFSVMAYYSLGPGGPLAWWFLATVLGASLYYLLFVRKRLKEEDLAHF